MAIVETDNVKERMEYAKRCRRERNAIHIRLKYCRTDEV
jgi:hypothetical protein